MQDRLLFVISPPRAGSTLLQRMLGSHAEIFTHPEPHLITPLAYLGYHDLVDAAPYDHINAAEAMRSFVERLPRGEQDYLDALRAYADTLYGRMLEPSGRRYFLDKTPAYGLVLPFLSKLYPDAHYIVLTRHPLAVMSSYANSFFNGDWHGAHAFNPIVERYVPALARFLESPPTHVLQVQYETLVARPADELARMFAFLGVDNNPNAVNYGANFQSGEGVTKGMGDPVTVHTQDRPVSSSIDKWVAELQQDERKRALADHIVGALHDDDVRRWGFERAELLSPVGEAAGRSYKKPKTNNYILQRRIMLALKKDIDKRPHGKLVRRIRYYCNVLLRE